jgi:hypothetical protein
MSTPESNRTKWGTVKTLFEAFYRSIELFYWFGFLIEFAFQASEPYVQFLSCRVIASEEFVFV